MAGARRTCGLGAGRHILPDQELLGRSRDAASSLPVPPQRWPCCTQRTALCRGFQGRWAHTETPTTRPCARGRPGACPHIPHGGRGRAPRCFSLVLDKIRTRLCRLLYRGHSLNCASHDRAQTGLNKFLGFIQAAPALPDPSGPRRRPESSRRPTFPAAPQFQPSLVPPSPPLVPTGCPGCSW